MACELCKLPDLAKHHLLQKIHTDIIRRGTSPSAALIVGTVEILDFRVPLVEMEVEIAATISAHQEAGKHIAFPFIGAALADFPPLLLDLLPYGTINNRLMHILENGPVFKVILDSLFVLVGFGIGLEVEDITAILLEGQYLCDGGTVPFRRRPLLAFSGPLDTLLEPIGPWGETPSRSSWAAICSVPSPSRVMLYTRRTTWAASSSTIQRFGLSGALM